MVVAVVPVAFTKVKFWRVEEPLASRVPKVPRPVEVRLPPLAELKKRLVEEAVVEKKLVVVAEVVVLWLAMKPPVKVEEAVERKPLRKPSVVEVETPQVVGVQAKALLPAPGQAVSQVSAEKQMVSKVPLAEKREVVVALVPVAISKKRELAPTKEPEKVELEIEALVKVPPLPKVLIREASMSTSLLDWLVTA